MFDIVTYKNYEKYFSENHENSYELLSGSGPVMISAPHSVEQTRNGSIKYAEPETGVLAKMLHEELGCPVIYKTGNKGDDANFDEESSYKNALIEYVKNNNILFVLDLHQLAPFRDVIIDIDNKFFNYVYSKAITMNANKNWEEMLGLISKLIDYFQLKLQTICFETQVQSMVYNVITNKVYYFRSGIEGWAYSERAIIYKNLGLNDMAIRDLLLAIKYNPNYCAVRTGLEMDSKTQLEILSKLQIKITEDNGKEYRK